MYFCLGISTNLQMQILCNYMYHLIYQYVMCIDLYDSVYLYACDTYCGFIDMDLPTH